MRNFRFLLIGFCLMTAHVVSAQIMGPPPKDEKKTDSNETVISNSHCAEITEFKYDTEDNLKLKIKNVCDQKIMSLYVRYMNGHYIMWNYSLEPGQEKDYSIYVGGYNVERGFILRAAIFQDGEGNGDEEGVRTIQTVFTGLRNELEKILGFLDPILENPPDNTKEIFSTLKKQFVALPDMTFNPQQVKVGGAVPSGKLNFSGRLAEIRARESSSDVKFVIGELKKMKTEVEGTLSTYPKTAAQN